MPSITAKLISPLLAIVLAGGLYTQMYAFAVADDTTEFHARVKSEIKHIPERLPMPQGPWVGTDGKAPEAALKLLRPNEIFARRYQVPDSQPWVSLLVIACYDTRDMSGHYPPHCYRGNGWTQDGPPEIRNYDLWGDKVPIARYQFTRDQFNNHQSWLVYDFFVLPTGEFETDMEVVSDASGDYRARPYGCAQIQVLMDTDTPEQEREARVRMVLEPIAPVIKALRSGPGRRS